MIEKIIKQLKSSDKSPEYYEHYPHLFCKYFDDVDENVVNELSKAGYCYYHSILLMDSIIDNKKFSDFPLISILQEETIKILTSLYGKDAKFWKYWNLRKQEYMVAIQIEKTLQVQKDPDWTVYKELADKKSTFGKIAIDSLYLLSNKKDKPLYKALLKSHYYFSIGFQLYDDLKDFKEDFENKQFNWAYYQLSQKTDLTQLSNDVHLLNKLLYTKGIAFEIMNKSILAFQKATDVLKPFPVQSKWLETIGQMKNTLLNYLDITVGYLKILETRIELDKNKPVHLIFFNYETISNTNIRKGLDFIRQDYLKDYAELKHVMYLSRMEDFKNDNQIHISDTFQRAMINDCLQTVAYSSQTDIKQYIDAEIDYLAGRVNKDSTGGWSYFPTVGEIAADIDDLGQIMQVLINHGKEILLKEFCTNPIAIALANRYNHTGGIATWIIPNENQTVQQQKQDLFNRTKWGTGPDVEVTANFAYALYLYDKEKYKATIRQSSRYICDNQLENGAWESRWYYGLYYGTYVCLRLLEKNKSKYQHPIRKALDFILDSQNADGGFGLQKNLSDALSTSFALLALKLIDKDNMAIKHVEEYLIRTQKNDGSWAAVDFIKPKASEPYKSKTLTTAFVLKSLC
ncbi:hypothetical protein FACS1894145_2370 [Bacteroidia bacterium]|nr:hypothetical protein FACS1894145_2370 [Bacteroidia bacterium]